MEAHIPVLIQDDWRYAALQLATHLRDESPIKHHLHTICGVLEQRGWHQGGLQSVEALTETHYGNVALSMIRGLVDCPWSGMYMGVSHDL